MRVAIRWYLDHFRVWPAFATLGMVAIMLAQFYAATKAGV